jgi:hypothetical protein
VYQKKKKKKNIAAHGKAFPLSRLVFFENENKTGVVL